ncbi:MAG: hypothetical protein JO152_06445 [Mycobacteriaceae bacterium]|nr:hypothetical protein [Mycobacteriaceae bacterium]
MAEPGETVPRYGEQPLEQTVAAAALMRRVAGMVLSLEHPHAAVDDMIERLTGWERELASAMPPDNSPRMGPAACDDQRIYLDHAADIWTFNPCFPEYAFDLISEETSHGTVNFPVTYEGPPGFVHGGFLAVFFDCVVQHHSCVTGKSGKTRSLNMRFRRPTPILTDLHFDVSRSESGAQADAVARLTLHDEVLCAADISTLAVPADKLITSQFGKRRSR